MITGSPYNRNIPRKDKDLPGYWAVLFVRAVVQHVAGHDFPSPLLLFEKINGEIVIAFTQNGTLGIRNGIVFAAISPTAHTLACLRFGGLITETVAGLTTDSSGSTPSLEGFAPT